MLESRAFADVLVERIRRVGSSACVGLDPVLDRLPAAVRSRHIEPLPAIGEFCRGVIRAAARASAAVKLQSACFERFGGAGVSLLEDLARAARAAGLVVILDGKRGDIGISAEHYAAGAVHAGVHAVTVNAYVGESAVEPFLRAGLGVFVLVRTSNPDSDALQSARLADGRTLAEAVADATASLGTRWMGSSGYSSVGAVIGATQAADGRALRRRLRNQFVLVPGYGAQGGTAEDVRALLDDRGGGVLVTASRSVIYAFDPTSDDWERQIGDAAERFAAEVAAVRP